ncbi:hypothetical protein AL387_gp056 [Salmon gill poxvirus]|uniref:Uncharacterized protein n=1 Tax=Salmon gill poxvirus TaxID=1680908 RepID=A0A0H4Y103_9POXV|nr:hypothetical protein AL387_gp056 [Salmon gill poxvirus]AKR04180.1 hypothetical protein SGPV056 [Salmon gill poxvirus]
MAFFLKILESEQQQTTKPSWLSVWEFIFENKRIFEFDNQITDDPIKKHGYKIDNFIGYHDTFFEKIIVTLIINDALYNKFIKPGDICKIKSMYHVKKRIGSINDLWKTLFDIYGLSYYSNKVTVIMGVLLNTDIMYELVLIHLPIVFGFDWLKERERNLLYLFLVSMTDPSVTGLFKKIMGEYTYDIPNNRKQRGLFTWNYDYSNSIYDCKLKKKNKNYSTTCKESGKNGLINNHGRKSSICTDRDSSCQQGRKQRKMSDRGSCRKSLYSIPEH